MTPTVEIHNLGNNTIVIQDQTQCYSEYIPEDLIDPESYKHNKYRYSDTCTINVIQKVGIEPDEDQYIGTIFTPHCTYIDEINYQFPKDGCYIIHHIILPTKEWFDKQKELGSSIFESDVAIFYTDGLDIYTYQNKVESKSSIDHISKADTDNTTISRIDIEYLAIDGLYNCYINLCKNVFKNIYYKCKTIDKNYTFDRDFIWMTINILKYYIELNQYREAQRLLEEINVCGGICNENNLPEYKNPDCGCGR